MAQFSAARRRAPAGLRRGAGAGRRVLRDLVLRTPPNAGGGILELIKGAGLGRRLFGLVARRQAAAARPVHQERGGLSRPLVRERRGEGRVRLRRHRRHLRQPLDAGHGLRAAAPLLRRGERQAGRLGPRHRRHGRHHARRWRARPRRAARASAPSAAVAGLIVEDGKAAGVRAAVGRARSRRAPWRPTSRPSCCSATWCPTAPSSPSCAGASPASSRARAPSA